MRPILLYAIVRKCCQNSQDATPKARFLGIMESHPRDPKLPPMRAQGTQLDLNRKLHQAPIYNRRSHAAIHSS